MLRRWGVIADDGGENYGHWGETGLKRNYGVCPLVARIADRWSCRSKTMALRPI